MHYYIHYFLLTALSTANCVIFYIKKLENLRATDFNKHNYTQILRGENLVKFVTIVCGNTKKIFFLTLPLSKASAKKKNLHKQCCVDRNIHIHSAFPHASFSKKLFFFLHSSFIHSTSVGLRGRCGFKECVWV
ncbi:hypothetical protein ACKWTF_001207 [Chironomus riparius]